jgi:hypothetical protein
MLASTTSSAAFRARDAPRRATLTHSAFRGTLTRVSPSDEIESETLRLNRRYMVEVVERFLLCPWAARSRLDGHVAECVFQQESPENFAPSLARVSELSVRPEIEIALFIYPCLGLARLDFEHFARRLRALDHDRHAIGGVPFAMAVFHPDATPQLDDAERLIPFLRRSPYPTLQLVRTSALERVRGGEVEGTAFLDIERHGAPPWGDPPPQPLRERIAQRNLAAVLEAGVATVEAAISAVHADRDATDARLGRPKRA